MPLVYVDSIKYLGFTFSRNHNDDDDMSRQMRTLYAPSNRIIWIFHNCSTKVLIVLGGSFCGLFYCSCIWYQYNKSFFLRFVLRIIIFIVTFCMFHLAVVLVKCLWITIFQNLKHYLKKKCFLLLLD